MQGRLGDVVRATGFAGCMMLEPAPAATFGTLAASGPSTVSQVHCAIALARPGTGGERACQG